MSAKPIAFSAPMVLAINEGRKTQTRRVLTAPKCCTINGRSPDWSDAWVDGDATDGGQYLHLPYGGGDLDQHECSCRVFARHAPGDLLWVQEAHRLATADIASICATVEYVADGVRRDVLLDQRELELTIARKNPPPHDLAYANVTPPRFMYRSLSRTTLRVTAVRVERLHAITEADAIAEGCDPVPAHGADAGPREAGGHWSARVAYRNLWESLYGPGSWALNPMVSVTTFEVVK